MKAYIPLVLLQPVAPDSHDALGLAYSVHAASLPAEFVFILRQLGKKAAVTKRRALEELKTPVEARVAEQDDYVVRAMLPAWLNSCTPLPCFSCSPYFVLSFYHCLPTKFLYSLLVHDACLHTTPTSTSLLSLPRPFLRILKRGRGACCQSYVVPFLIQRDCGLR